MPTTINRTDFTRLFNPRGIAIIGASGDADRPGGQTVHALTQQGYKGGIYPVNPKYPELQGHRCFAAVTEIDQPCDVAVVALPAAHVPAAITQCGKSGIGFAVVVGGGFREVSAEGVQLEQRMLAAAHAAGVRVIGPNCLGVVNVHDRVFAGIGSITRPPYLTAGGVSAVIQSGGFGNSMLLMAADAGLSFRHVVASGQESDIDAAELIQAFVKDEKTRVIFAYLESVKDGRAFMQAARSARDAGKPLVVIKAGNTAQGIQAAASHTASMTSAYDIYRTAFRQCGVVEARDVNDAVDFLLCLSAEKRPRGRRVAVASGSGGTIVNFSDACDEYGLTLAPLTAPTTTVLDALLPAIATKQNPVDYTTGFANEKNSDRYGEVLRAIANDDNIDQLAVFHPVNTGAKFTANIKTVISAVQHTDKPVIVLSSIPSHYTTEGRALLAAAGIPVLGSPRRVAACMNMLAYYAESRLKREESPAKSDLPDHEIARLPAGAMLDEFESKKLLSTFGIPVTKDVLFPVESPVSALPQGMRFPVVVKIASRDIAHKTDIGAVRLNIVNDGQLAAAVADVVANSRAAAPEAKLSGVLVSEMVADGLETIIGVVNDASFGPVVAFGLGGVLAETLRDTTYRIAPFGLDTAREMISELRAAAVFNGVRGQPPRDVDSLASTLVAVSEFAWLMRKRLSELDLNPVLVLPRGRGVVAADALLLVR